MFWPANFRDPVKSMEGVGYPAIYTRLPLLWVIRTVTRWRHADRQ